MIRKRIVAGSVLGVLLAALAIADSTAGEGMRGVAPVVADIMGQTQLRHIKLGYAGRVGNWELASYETHQIRRSFEEAAKAGGTIDDRPISKWFEQESLPEIGEIDKAIEKRDVRRFNSAFEDLTRACNACHRAANIGFVKMQVPTASPFSNQSFPP